MLDGLAGSQQQVGGAFAPDLIFQRLQGCAFFLELAVQAARVIDANWLADIGDRPVMAKVRSMSRPVLARMDGEWLRFDSPEYGVAPGQAAVLYDGDRVLGGGWIEETMAVEMATAA